MTTTITLQGDTQSDLILAAEAALESLKNGNLAGFDRNETGSYCFESTGEFVDHYRTKRNGKILKKKHQSYHEAIQKAGDQPIPCQKNGKPTKEQPA